MTTGNGGADDEFWRRPPEPPGGPAPGSTAGESAGATGAPPPGSWGPAAEPPCYLGPPPTSAPPPGWRPPIVNQPPLPRRLPDQDLDALDARESNARTLTYGLAMIAGAVLVVVSCLLCSRLLF